MCIEKNNIAHGWTQCFSGNPWSQEKIYDIKYCSPFHHLGNTFQSCFTPGWLLLVLILNEWWPDSTLAHRSPIPSTLNSKLKSKFKSILQTNRIFARLNSSTKVSDFFLLQLCTIHWELTLACIKYKLLNNPKFSKLKSSTNVSVDAIQY